MILSDGLDYYIDYILRKHGIRDVDYRANHMYFNNGSIEVEFPYVNKGCGRCGNCKRWHIESHCQDGELIIYVGDGYSDRYAIRSANVVFASNDLAEYCIKEDLEYIPFEHFYDILNYLKKNDEKV